MNDEDDRALKANKATEANKAKKADPEVDPGEVGEHLTKDINQIRDNLGDLVGELDHRRHELFDWRLQLRRHGLALAIGTVVVAGLVAGGVAVHRARQPSYPRLSRRWNDLRDSVALAVGRRRREPQAKPALAKQIVGAAAAALASVLARRLAERFLKPRPKPAR